MERTVLEVRLFAPLLCACPSVIREEPNNNNARAKRRPISHLPPGSNPSFYLQASLPFKPLVRCCCEINRVADIGSAGCGERDSNCHREIAVCSIGTCRGQGGVRCARHGNSA